MLYCGQRNISRCAGCETVIALRDAVSKQLRWVSLCGSLMKTERSSSGLAGAFRCPPDAYHCDDSHARQSDLQKVARPRSDRRASTLAIARSASLVRMRLVIPGIVGRDVSSHIKDGNFRDHGVRFLLVYGPCLFSRRNFQLAHHTRDRDLARRDHRYLSRHLGFSLRHDPHIRGHNFNACSAGFSPKCQRPAAEFNHRTLRLAIKRRSAVLEKSKARGCNPQVERASGLCAQLLTRVNGRSLGDGALLQVCPVSLLHDTKSCLLCRR
jgi:hypothetical protein